MRTRTQRISTVLAGLLVPGLLLAACSSAGSSAPATTTTSGGTVSTSSIPAGTVLRIGEQLHNLSSILSLGGQDQGFGYTVQYSEFVGGPPLLQAFQGGAEDVGYVFSTPLIYAQSANQGLTAVTTWATENSSYSLVSAPGDASTLKGWASLKGKRVVYQVGTASEAVLLEGLQSVGLTLSDITTVNLPVTQTAAALQGGSADAGITVEPLLSVYLQANPSAKVVASSNRLTDKSGFLIASASTLADKGKSAALADYLTRLIKAYKVLNANPQLAIDGIYIKQYNLTPARAAAVAKAAGPTTFGQLPGKIVADQQNLANLFFTAQVIPAKIDVSSEFDGRFNSLVTQVQGS